MSSSTIRTRVTVPARRGQRWDRRARAVAAGRLTTIVSPPPGVSSAVSVPPMASVKPAGDAEAEAEPARVAVAEPLERGEQAVGLASGDARTGVDDAQFDAVARGRCRAG